MVNVEYLENGLSQSIPTYAPEPHEHVADQGLFRPTGYHTSTMAVGF